jgi:hypothetical protein
MDSSPTIAAAAASPYFDSLVRRRQQKKMSITQTYYLAHTARKKLTREASRADHDLRLLVGHANLLDSLMFDLADAEREQERWFNQTVNGATKSSPPSSRQHIQWASTVVEEPEEWEQEEEEASDSDSDASDSDSEYDESDFIINPPRRRAPSPVAFFHEDLLEEDEGEDTDSDFEYDDAEDLDELSLTRSPSRQSPPELLADSDNDSDDDAAMPPSPPQPQLEAFNEKASADITLAVDDQPHLFEQGYFGVREQIIEAY